MSPGRQLRVVYNRLRSMGYSDVQAHAELAHQREAQAEERHQQVEAIAADVMLATLARRYEPEARRRLSQAGAYREDQVKPAALQLARWALHQRQPARLPDEWVQAARPQIAVPARR
jgi:DNA-binding TFAR19-related protein (PDSD5 family)